jgi:integrase-like protein
VDNGASIAAVQKVLGHKSIETTMQYVHATDEGKTPAVETLEKTLKPGASGFPLTMRTQNEKWRWCDLLNVLILWWPLEDSNLQPKDYESSALPLS